MRTLVGLQLLWVVGGLAAQSPLMMPFASNSGLVASGAQVFFDLDVVAPGGVSLHALDVNSSSAPGTFGSVEVWVGPATYVGSEQNAAAWTLAVSGVVVSAGTDQPSHVCLGTSLFLTPGSHGVALRHVGVGLRYTLSTGTNNTGTTAELHLTAGASQSVAFGSAPIAGRVVNGNLYYDLGVVPARPCAAVASNGLGCYEGADSWYEAFAGLANLDLAGTPTAAYGVVATPAGPNSVTLTAGPCAWYAPTGSQVHANASPTLAVTDDTMAEAFVLPFAFPFPGGSTSVLHACANGYLVLGATTATTSDFTPTATELLAQAPRLCPLWADLHAGVNATVHPASGLYYDVDPAGQIVYVTWLDVADRRGGVPAAGATTVNVQCALHAGGAVEFRYGAIVPRIGGTGAVVVGASKGSLLGTASHDAGPHDLSAGPHGIVGPDREPLALAAGLPRLGATLTLAVTGVPPVVPVGFVFAGDQPLAGIDLGFLGAPGCRAYSNANLGALSLPVAAGAGSLAISIPNVSALVGVTLVSQAVAFALDNPLNLVTSNGLTWTIGN